MQCHKCGHVNQAGKKFCPKCGASLVEAARVEAEQKYRAQLQQLEEQRKAAVLEQERLDQERKRKRQLWQATFLGTNSRKTVTIASAIGALLLLVSIAIRFANQRAAEQRELAHCDDLIANNVVSFRDPIPGASCQDRQCVLAEIAKLQSHRLQIREFAQAGAMMRACVGYRVDLGGTREGAQCIMKILGEAYTLSQPYFDQRDTHYCQGDGYPYIVGVK